MRTEPLNYNIDHVDFIDKHGEELEKGIIHEEDISDIFDMILEMAISDIISVKSNLTNLYMHLLKYQYRFDYQTRSWVNTIRRCNFDLDETISQSKALSRKITPELQKLAYDKAKKYASSETNLDIQRFPEECPYDIDFVLDKDKIENFLWLYAYTDEVKQLLS